MDKEKVLLGSGHLFLTEVTTDGEIPENLFNDSNNVGSISGGAEMTYTPTIYNVENDDNEILESFITKEEAVLKTGVLNWNLENINKVTVGGTYDSSKNTLTIGGKKNVKKLAVGFEHTEDNYKLQVAMIGIPQKGLTINFNKEKETIVDAEFNASKLSNGEFVKITENNTGE